MSLPPLLQSSLRIPAVAAPMFLASGPELVIETCKSGVVGSFPALNQRSSAGFEQWLQQITSALRDYEKDTGKTPAPFAVNLISHKSNDRLEADLALCEKYKVPLIITSLGAVKSLIDKVHNYGGLVFHDVTTLRHARKAADAGVDGLIAVSAGAGGHAGTLNPFALVSEIREFFDKTLLLSGAISRGSDIVAARAMGADLAYLGTRFICTKECLAVDDYKQMIIESDAKDILYTPNISGVYANFLIPSVRRAGLDPANLTPPDHIDFGTEFSVDADKQDDSPQVGEKTKGAWLNIWSAGQGVANSKAVQPVAELVADLEREYRQTLSGLCST